LERLIILGCGSALPASGRNPTSQVLEHNGKYFLIDCGEGTQTRLRENKLSFNKITTIFISHLHGDHYLGLPGLISSMQLLGRTNTLNLFGPPGIWSILELQFKLSNSFF
jgi:ribonuclease Z